MMNKWIIAGIFIVVILSIVVPRFIRPSDIDILHKSMNRENRTPRTDVYYTINHKTKEIVMTLKGGKL